MQISAITVGAFEVNCWVLATPQRKAIVIDPGADAADIDTFLKNHNLDVCGYIITHGHMDHISALAALCERYAVPIHMHPADAEWAFSEQNQMLPYYDVPTCPPSHLLHADLTEETSRTLFGLEFQIVETPGHSPGSVCVYVPEARAMFTGDTLFAGSVGRTDFPKGDSEQLKASLLHLRQSVPVETALHPGHGKSTTLETEISSNPFMR